MPNKLSRRDFLKTTGAAAAAAGFGAASFSSRMPRTLAAPTRQDLPRLVYIIRGAAQRDVQLIQDAMSEYMAERIGATIELRFIEPGAYNDQMALINAAAEDYDLVFTAPWTNNYYTNVNQEYLTQLDDLLLEQAPGLWNSMTPETWEAARVQGGIYGAINQQIFVKPFGPFIHEAVIDELGIGDALAAVTNYQELSPILAQINEYVQSSDQYTYVSGNAAQVAANEIWGYDPVDAQLSVKSTDESATAVIFAATDEFRQAAELIREWYLAGYVPTDVLTPDQIEAGTLAGIYPVGLASVVKPGGEAEALARWGWPVKAYAIAEPLLTTAGTTATLTGISSTSSNPELAAQYLNLINTDPVFYNLLGKGIQGTHWEWEDEAQQLIKPAGDAASFTEVGWNPNTDWMFGNVFNSYYSNPAQVGAWPATAELNRSARPSPVLGFTFNRQPVETELASISSAWEEYSEPVLNGLLDVDEGISTLLDALSAAGIERVQEEMQGQIDTWKAANA